MRSLEALDATILRALRMQPEQRFSTAREMALEIERMCPPATASEVGDWVEHVALDVLNSRAAMVAEIESSGSHHHVEGDESHVMSVLNAKNTLGPGRRPSASQRFAGPEAPPDSRKGSDPMLSASPAARDEPDGSPRAHWRRRPPFVPDARRAARDAAVVDLRVDGQLQRAADGERTQAPPSPRIIGLLLGASVLASALVYRQSTRRTPAASDTTLGDPTAVAQPTTATPPPIPLPSPAATDEPEPAPKATAATPTTHGSPGGQEPADDAEACVTADRGQADRVTVERRLLDAVLVRRLRA